MIVIVHFLLVLLATISGYDIVKRILPVRVAPVLARVLAGVLATILWIFCPTPILIGLAVVGGLMVLGPYISSEPHTPWLGRITIHPRARKPKPKPKVWPPPPETMDKIREHAKGKVPAI
jgi:hypothetical protein